ncbi:MAG: efflux RND transporter periplasmic adaptor subunit [Spirochaetaceae bacterium]|nr:efflux RND transporter periplasmic adaptor subunit [Spirochaetaceae bacterium]MCF7947685.1 efflux RND transporter periplasmic adaptor subunit [Spirochaetia bacterium]MCF7950512.1 efflux RND transporter periplasmic adaptor subunit [Spirochaetaceae bacterium]
MKKAYSLISLLIVSVCTTMFVACTAENENVDGTGTIEAREVDVSATQAGTLLRLEVEEGELVQPDQNLAQIDNEIQQRQLRQAESKRAQAAAQLELLLAGPHPKDIEAAEAQLAQANEQLELARKEWERIKTLYEENNVSKKQYDSGLAAYRTRQAQYKAAQASLEKLKNLARPQEVSSARAAVESADQQVAIASRQFNDCQIKAPIEGYISELYYEVGELVPAGRKVATISHLEQVYVTVYVPEPLLSRIQIGQNAEVYVDGRPDTLFSGRITHISQEAEFTPKNVQTKQQRVKLVYAIKLEVQNKDNILKPGMPADVNLGLEGEEGE